MQKSMNKKGIIIITIVSFILGIIITRQFLLSQKIKANVNSQNNEALAYEVSELFKNNEKLEIEVNKLKTEVENLDASSQNQKVANDTLEENLKNYQIILGSTNVIGDGVRITFDKKITSVQLIDLINALKNIGIDAIAINDQRINLYSSIEEGTFLSPTKVDVIGDKKILKTSLTRSGGIMDQIGYGQVEEVDNLVLGKVK